MVTSIDRVEAAIALEVIDRPPVDPRIVNLGQSITGNPLSKHLFSFNDIYRATKIAMRNLGDFDIVPNVMNMWTEYMAYFTPFKSRIPGYDGWPDHQGPQVLDSEVLSHADCLKIHDKGFLQHFFSVLAKSEDLRSRFPDKWLEQMSNLDPKSFDYLVKFSSRLPYFLMRPYHKMWARQGKFIYAGAHPYPPFEAYIQLRSYQQGMRDLCEQPDLVEKTIKRIFEESIGLYIRNVKASGAKTAMIGGAFGSQISLEMYEIFDFPYTKAMIEELVNAGITPVLHYDNDWTDRLHYFRDFPAKKCILHLDGSTDMRYAKEVLGDMMCLMGNVPASLLAFHTPYEVAKYCCQLIADVGPAGFILAPGCEAPVNSRLINLETMIRAAHYDSRVWSTFARKSEGYLSDFLLSERDNRALVRTGDGYDPESFVYDTETLDLVHREKCGVRSMNSTGNVLVSTDPNSYWWHNLDTDERVKLADDVNEGDCFMLSPDGNHVLFERRDANSHRIYDHLNKKWHVIRLDFGDRPLSISDDGTIDTCLGGYSIRGN
ncbi:MAG: uroporphyrinogen decarboxylase family protein [Candidatus Woesearchaeota archaeon]